MTDHEKSKPRTIHLVLVAVIAAAVALSSQWAVENLLRYLHADQQAESAHPNLRHRESNRTVAARRLRVPLVDQILQPAEAGQPCGPDGVDESLLSCLWMPAANGHQCCCRFKQPAPRPKPPADSGGYRFACLPNAIVIGAQKSGSSALYSHMVRHPAAVPFMAKEAHFFDRDETFAKGIRHYLSSALDPIKLLHARTRGALGQSSLVDLHGANAPPAELQAAQLPPTYNGFEQSQVLRAQLGKTFTLETTPAYVLDSRAAVKIATLVPHVKLLLILRNPVDRAYSEWNMKLRRVQAQFHASDTAHLQRVYRHLIQPCFNHPKREHPYNNTPSTAAEGGVGGAPPIAGQQRGLDKEPHGQHAAADVYRCLVKHLPKDGSVARLLRPASVLRGVVAPCLVKGTDQPWAKRPSHRGIPDYRSVEARPIPVPRDAGSQYSQWLAALDPGLPSVLQAKRGAGGVQPAGRRAVGVLQHGAATKFLDQFVAGAHRVARQLGVLALASVRGVQAGASPWDAPPGTHTRTSRHFSSRGVDSDAQELRRVLARLPKTTTLPPLDLAKRCLSPPLVRPEQIPPVTSLTSEADVIAAHCLRSDGSVRWGEVGCWANGLTSNIVSEFVARGLYLPQLQSFHAVFGKDRVMVISDVELLDEKQRVGTLARVFSFLGLPELDSPALEALADGKSTQAEFMRLFPDFERTGWQAKSTYAPLPSGIRARLQTLFKPLNKQLYEYLGRDMGWDGDQA